MSKKFILQIILFSFIILIIGGTFYYINRDKKNDQKLSNVDTERNQNKDLPFSYRLKLSCLSYSSGLKVSQRIDYDKNLHIKASYLRKINAGSDFATKHRLMLQTDLPTEFNFEDKLSFKP